VIGAVKKMIGAAQARGRLMVEIVDQIVMGSDGTAAAVGTAGIDDDGHQLDTVVGWQFGFYSRPNDGVRGLVLKADGQGNTAFLLAYRDMQYELSLNKGECGMQNAFSASVLLDQNGNVTAVPGGSGKVLLGAASGTQPAVLGDTLETRLADLEAKFLAHMHQVSGATSAPVTGCPGTFTGAAAATTSTLPHAADVIKSSNTEVSP
jgi:phage gp45-like